MVLKSIWLAVLACVALTARAADLPSNAYENGIIKRNSNGDYLWIVPMVDGGLERLFLETKKILYMNYPTLCDDPIWSATPTIKSDAEKRHKEDVLHYQKKGYKVISYHQCHLPASLLNLAKDWKTEK